MFLLRSLRPNQAVSQAALRIYGVAWVGLFLLGWAYNGFDVLPTPREVLRALGPLLAHGLLFHLLSSLRANLTALALATALSLGLAYLSVVPLLRPLTSLTEKLRFWGFAGVGVAFTLWFHDAHDLKIALLVFGMTGFFVTGMHDEVKSIPRARYDYARTLGMSEWRVVWEVVVRGTLDRAIDILRQNAAMGWMLLTLVETLVRSEGGVGVLLANESKHLDLAAVAALQGVIFAIGLLEDVALAVLKRSLCPHANLKLERNT